MTDDIRRRIVEFLPRLRRFAYALTGDLDRGDDLVQETCARALSRLDQLQPGTRLDSWMFRIAQTQWFDRIRARPSFDNAVTRWYSDDDADRFAPYEADGADKVLAILRTG